MLGDSLVWSSRPAMSGDTTSSDMTWAHAACSVDQLDKAAEDKPAEDKATKDGAVNERAVSTLGGRGRLGCTLAIHEMTEYVRAAHEATADTNAAAGDSMDALCSLPTGRLLVDRKLFVRTPFDQTLFAVAAFRSALLKNRTALGGAGALRAQHFERVVRSGERCSLYGGSAPR